MANAETTFDDRWGRGETLIEAVKLFAPPYAPSDTNLTFANFTTFLQALKAKNILVLNKREDYTTSAGERFNMSEDIKQRALMIKSYFNSVKALKGYVKTITSAVNKIRNVKPPKKSVPTPPSGPGGTTTPEAKKRNQGEQSFSEIATMFESLNSLLATIAGYTPGNNELKLLQLQTLATNFKLKNKDLGGLDKNITLLTNQRSDLYDGEDGLREKMKAIKEAVSSQYKPSSSEYKSIKGIRV